jgi:polyketide-type polyunsaturated fatty acid synthase PfaA
VKKRIADKREENSREGGQVPLAIIGMSCLFPKADGLEGYWANLKNGVDAITDIPASRWNAEDYFDPDPKAPDMTYARRGGFLSPCEFDPLEFGISPNDIEATDTSQLLALMVARRALQDAGVDPGGKDDLRRASVILGVTGSQELVIPLGARLGHPRWRRALKGAGVDDRVAEDVVRRIADSYVSWKESSFPGLLGNVIAGRIANRLNLGGTNCVVDAACASSFGAIHLAGLELAARRADLVVTGGVDTFNDIFMYMCFSKTPALSPTGDARPFAADADGTILGEGLGLVVLKRLDDAERDGDSIYAVIRGIGASSDGRGTAIYEPNAEGQSRALRSAYDLLGVTPETIELVEAHGTGTKVGDAVEIAALTEVYRSNGHGEPWCAVGSVKSMIGHTKAAAGVAGLIKAALALRHKVLPPTIKVRHPDPAFAPGTTAFYVNTRKRPWLPRQDHPRRAAISSFGFGGSNFHCVLEEHGPEKAAADWDGDVQILSLSGESRKEIAAGLASFAGDLPWERFRAMASETRKTFNHDAHCRLVAVVERGRTTPAEAVAEALSMMEIRGDGTSWNTPGGVSFGSGPRDGKLAALFPGQGSQYVGMLRDLACQFPQMLDTLAEADIIFRGLRPGKKRLTDLIFPHPSFDDVTAAADREALKATEIAQPALGAVSLGTLRILEHFDVRPEAAAGHSYGELTALCASGRFSAEALFRLSLLRGELMANGEGDRGAMLAVQAPAGVVEKALVDEGFDLVLANRNAPEQMVLSGAKSEIEKASVFLAGEGVPITPLTVSAAFHSPLVAEARRPFERALKKIPFEPARIPVFANSTAGEYPESPDRARELLAAQLASPVDFVAEIENLYETGVRTFLEIGPGRRLTGLVRAILGDRDHGAAAVDSSSGKRSGIADLALSLAWLASRGFDVLLDRWDESRPVEDEGEKKPAFTIPLDGGNYVAPRTADSDSPGSRAARPAPPAAPAPARTSHAAPRPLPLLPDGGHSPDPADQREWQEALLLSQKSLEALQKIQEQTAQLHTRFLEGQEDALRTIQALIEQQRLLQPDAPPLLVPPTPDRATAASEDDSPGKPAAGTSSPPEAGHIPPRQAAGTGVEEALLDVVAQKTGYPVDMLNLEMNLDTRPGRLPGHPPADRRPPGRRAPGRPGPRCLSPLPDRP